MRELARKRVGVDAYGWLHKGVFSCAGKLCNGEDTRRYVDYCMFRVRMLLHFGVIPVMVFDGAALPMKADTHADRQEKRDDALKKGMAAQASGNSRLAEEMFQRACSVNPKMAREVIKECRKLNVEYVVAPYEADAQLAWMIINGHVDCVITEDSDLVVYGASKIMYKMTKTGDGDYFQIKNLPALNEPPMHNVTPDMFMWMCVCSGCDFFSGVPGLGIRKAHTLVKRHSSITRLLYAISRDRRLKVSRTFQADFRRACLVFRHQVVIDYTKGVSVHLREIDEVALAGIPPGSGICELDESGEVDLSFLGRLHDSRISKQIAEGLIHPSSLKEYADPLDVIERPIVSQSPRKQRQRSRAAPARIAGSSSGQRSIRGFQVQAAGPSQRFLPLAPNLRRRLSPGVRDFNPRRTAAQFAARSGERGGVKTVTASAGVWTKFVRPKSGSSAGSGPVEGNLSALASRATSHIGGIRNTAFAGKRTQPSLSPGGPPLKRFGSTTASQAVERALGRFAIRPETDSRAGDDDEGSDVLEIADLPDEPPSPDCDAYAVFEAVDNDCSREPPEPADPDNDAKRENHGQCQTEVEAEKPERSVVVQSRFFASNRRLSLPVSENGKPASAMAAIISKTAPSASRRQGSRVRNSGNVSQPVKLTTLDGFRHRSAN